MKSKRLSKIAINKQIRYERDLVTMAIGALRAARDIETVLLKEHVGFGNREIFTLMIAMLTSSLTWIVKGIDNDLPPDFNEEDMPF